MRQRIYRQLAVSQAVLLAGGLGWLGLGTVVSSGMAIAQEVSTDADATIPGASDLLSVPQMDGAPASPGSPTAPPETLPSIDVTPVTPEFSVSGGEIEAPSPVGELSGSSASSTYIDPTDYSLGATQAPSVVLSERSTGCSTVVHHGQTVPNSLCRSTGSGTLHGAATGYGSSPNSVRVGPLSIGPNGIRVTRSLNINDYYNRTERPTALLGNGNASLMFPLSAPAMITSPFGWRVHPIFGNTRFHTGTDLAAPLGTPVVAAYSGEVTVADFLGGYGLTVVLRHNEQTAETLYGHLSEIFVRPGETIAQGEVIGRVGSTGNSTGPHLHFELRQPSGNGWVAINAGGLLTGAIAQVTHGFQFASADGLQALGKDVSMLDVPEFLQAGKNAIKSASESDGSESETAKADVNR